MANKPRYIEEGDQAAHTDVAEGLQQIPLEELDRLLELSGEGGDAAERLAADEVGDASPEEVILLMDRAYGGGRRVGGIGDSALLVSEDGLRAFFRGALPADATYADVMAELAKIPNLALYGFCPTQFMRFCPNVGPAAGGPLPGPRECRRSSTTPWSPKASRPSRPRKRASSTALSRSLQRMCRS